MKILHVISSLEIGGAQRLLSDLIPIQKQQGLEVSLLVNEPVRNEFTDKVEKAGVRIISLDNPRYNSPKNILLIRKIIKDYDVVHVHLFPSLYWVALASVGLGVKLVYTEHSTSNRRRDKNYLRPIERFIYNRYDRIIAISKQTKDALQRWLKASDARFAVINNGVDTKAFADKRRQVVPKSLIMVSRFVASKDQETVIKALGYLDDDVTLRLVGEGANMEHCKIVAQQAGVADRVSFLGSRSDIAELIAESYIGIQSSNWEGFGLTAVELMAAGKPVIVSDVDGLKQVVDGAGETFRRGDERDLAAKISRLLDSRTLYDDVARKCQERAGRYDISVMAEKYGAVYDTL